MYTGVSVKTLVLVVVVVPVVEFRASVRVSCTLCVLVTLSDSVTVIDMAIVDEAFVGVTRLVIVIPLVCDTIGFESVVEPVVRVLVGILGGRLLEGVNLSEDEYVGVAFVSVGIWDTVFRLVRDSSGFKVSVSIGEMETDCIDDTVWVREVAALAVTRRDAEADDEIRAEIEKVRRRNVLNASTLASANGAMVLPRYGWRKNGAPKRPALVNTSPTKWFVSNDVTTPFVTPQIAAYMAFVPLYRTAMFGVCELRSTYAIPERISMTTSPLSVEAMTDAFTCVKSHRAAAGVAG
jgi:hypothetical protein